MGTDKANEHLKIVLMAKPIKGHMHMRYAWQGTMTYYFVLDSALAPVGRNSK